MPRKPLDEIAQESGCKFEKTRSPKEFLKTLVERYQENPHINVGLGQCFGICCVYLREHASTAKFQRQLSQFGKSGLILSLQAQHTAASDKYAKKVKRSITVDEYIDSKNELLLPGIVIEMPWVSKFTYSEENNSQINIQLFVDVQVNPGNWLLGLAGKEGKHAFVVSCDTTSDGSSGSFRLYDPNYGVFTSSHPDKMTRTTCIQQCLNTLLTHYYPHYFPLQWHFLVRYNPTIQISHWEVPEMDESAFQGATP